MQPLLSRSLVVLAVLSWSIACDSGDDSDTSADEQGETETTSEGTETGTGTETGGLITNACGTFDPNEPGDSVIPQDPDDPEIIAACTALCEVYVALDSCQTDAAVCLETCKLRSCPICPGTLAPLVTCETEMFGTGECTCTPDGIDCSTPPGCSDLADATGFCGG